MKEYGFEDTLVIDCRSKDFKIYDRNYYINIYGIRNILKSFVSLKKNNISFECEYLVGNLLTNYNSFFVISAFSYSKLILLDDGIGTPVTLKYPDYYNRLTKHLIKNVLMSILFVIFFGKKFKMTDSYIRDIYFYYTVYNFASEIPSKKISVIGKSSNIILGLKCFLGQPVVEFRHISLKRYIAFLKLLINSEGPLVYYPHPSEHRIAQEKIPGLIVRKNDIAIEKLFLDNGIPEYIFSFYSSTLLNIKEMNKDVNLFFISNDFSITSKEISSYYKELLLKYKINQHPISINT
jgi:hypothetical protein